MKFAHGVQFNKLNDQLIFIYFSSCRSVWCNVFVIVKKTWLVAQVVSLDVFVCALLIQLANPIADTCIYSPAAFSRCFHQLLEQWRLLCERSLAETPITSRSPTSDSPTRTF